MTSPMEGATFIFMWLGFLLLMSCCVAAGFLWAIRGGQFANQERARYLALQSGIPGDDGSDADSSHESGGARP